MTPPDEGQGGMDSGLPAPAQVTARVASLVERGLERYGTGDLAGALGEWEHALALDPAAAQAREYIDYVRDNFATLDEQFRAATAIKDATRAAGVPMPEEPEEVSGAYDLVELEESPLGDLTPVSFDPGRVNGDRAAAERADGADEGWELDDLGALPLPPPPPSTPTHALTDSGLDEDLAAVAAGLQFRDTGAPIPLLEEDGGANGAADDDDDYDGPGQVLEMEVDDPDMDPAVDALENTRAPTVPGGQAPPPFPDHPELSEQAILALSGKIPTVTIRPRARRDEGSSAGTIPGFIGTSTLPEDAQTPVPGELPAPPHVATPPALELELGSMDPALGADGAQDGRGLDLDGYEAGESIDMIAEPADAYGDDQETPPIGHLPDGIGEAIGGDMLGLSGDDTGEATRPSGAKRSLELLPEEMPIGPIGSVGDEPLDLGDADFDDQPRTAERLSAADAGARSPFAGDMTAGFAEGADGRAVSLGPARAPAVIVDEQLLRGIDDSGDEVTNARARLPDVGQLGVAAPGAGARAATDTPTSARQSLPEGLPPDTDEDLIRRRVSELLGVAREAAERGDHLAAVEAAEAASSEDPDGKIGPVILHRHRDLLYRVYEGHIGEMTQVPLLAVPLHQIAAERLDHKTGFLLSRIDGLLSFEDILDVAGMPRLDAYRILSNLLRRGFIEVR